jgi:hypothetical protein
VTASVVHRPGFFPESACVSSGHVSDTAGVGYCVRCGHPSGAAKRARQTYRGPEPDEVPTYEDDHREDDPEARPRRWKERAL